ncbi:uncharacterized protein [Chanodichthys erythropterus]|uniref:uncharacterized protein isoform X2 n=1 Tax=Chanodichthys erythropterus TaxID=933992 RepID=UPI00351EB394
MKNYSEISVFLLIICVFGADGGDVKIVSVQKGDSVTLDTGLRGQINLINWKFGDSDSVLTGFIRDLITYPEDERFRGRLKLNNQTGSLTINNMRVTDSGLYHVWINYNYGRLFRTFIVTVDGVFDEDEDEVKTVSGMEGDSVTLDAGLREKFDRIKWRFGDSGSFIAEIDSNEISYPLNDTERFRDRLKMNNQTGSLIIKNMRITDSGVYEIEIDQDSWNPYTVFNIVVCGPFYPDPVLSPGEIAAIVGVILLVLAGVIYCCMICIRRRQNPAEKPNTMNSNVLHMVPEEKMQMNFRYSTVE